MVLRSPNLVQRALSVVHRSSCFVRHSLKMGRQSLSMARLSRSMDHGSLRTVQQPSFNGFCLPQNGLADSPKMTKPVSDNGPRWFSDDGDVACVGLANRLANLSGRRTFAGAGRCIFRPVLPDVLKPWTAEILTTGVLPCGCSFPRNRSPRANELRSCKQKGSQCFPRSLCS